MPEKYTGVKVIADFADVEELCKAGEMALDKFNLDSSFPNMLLVIKYGKRTVLGIVKGDKVKVVKYEQTIRNITSRNKEQSLLIELLRDPNIDCVTVSGPAGSGKTLIALAYAMERMERGEINKIVLAKNLTPLGREIGFLKGSMDEKVRPWAGAFFDNFEILGIPYYELDDMMSPTSERQKEKPGRVEISPTTFIQGRSISNAVIIVDEAQNLPVDVIKQILTRPSEGSKIILLGDLTQTIEKDALKNNGFAAAIEAGKGAQFIGHITLLKCVRSRLAAWFASKL